MASRRFAHHDDWFRELCERGAGWLAAAASPTAIDTYSLEKLEQVERLLPELRAHVAAKTGTATPGEGARS